MTTTQSIGVSLAAANVIKIVKNAVAKSPTGVSFIRIKNYTNKFGEVANHTINVGANYAKAVEKDIATLENMDVTTMEWKSAMVDILKAKTTLIEAFKNPNEARSAGQQDAYTNIGKGLKIHNETGNLYVWGFRVKKQILVEGVYPVVNSRKDTIAKDELRKFLRTNKFVNYSIAVGNELTGWGNTLVIKF